MTSNRIEIDFADLEEKLKDENNKVMVFCSPHNPTGRVWAHEEVQKLADLSLKYKKILISDEIFADLAYEGYKHTVTASLSKEIA